MDGWIVMGSENLYFKWLMHYIHYKIILGSDFLSTALGVTGVDKGEVHLVFPWIALHDLVSSAIVGITFLKGYNENSLAEGPKRRLFSKWNSLSKLVFSNFPNLQKRRMFPFFNLSICSISSD